MKVIPDSSLKAPIATAPPRKMGSSVVPVTQTRQTPNAGPSQYTKMTLPSQGSAQTNVCLKIIKDECLKTVLEDGVPTLLKKDLSYAAKATVHVLHHTGLPLSLKVASKASKAALASIPLAGAAVSAVEAKNDFQRAKLEKAANHPWAARAFKASSILNGFDASIGIVSTAATASVVGIPVAAGAEVVGWVSTGLGFTLGVTGEFLSAYKR